MIVSYPRTVEEAIDELQTLIDELQTFFESDLYTKFRPETKIKGEKWYRQDYFKNEREFFEYIDSHFNILSKQIKRIQWRLKWQKTKKAQKNLKKTKKNKL